MPAVAVARLTRYLTCVQALRGENTDWISSQSIADALGITSATVRRDLAGLDVGGVTNRGYAADRLYNGLVKFLGADTGWKAVVVGAGNMGKALALHGNLARLGFVVCGIFDIDGRKVGKKVGELVVRPMNILPQAIHEGNVDIGIIAVPGPAAQSVADIMIMSGIRGVFNLSFAHIAAPAKVKNMEGRLVAGMLELGHALKHQSSRAHKTKRKNKRASNA